MNLGMFARPALLVAVALFAGQSVLAQDVPAAAAPDLKYSNKWRIEVKEGSNNDGVARFLVTPQGEAAIEVTVNIRDGRSETGVARDVRDSFKAALDKTRFKVEGDDFEDVLVKKRKGPNFEVKLVESTVKGTRVNIEKE